MIFYMYYLICIEKVGTIKLLADHRSIVIKQADKEATASKK